MFEDKSTWNIWGTIKQLSTVLFLAVFVLYCAIYFCAPCFLNKKDFSFLVTKTVEENTGLVLLIDGHKLSLSPKLDIKLKTDGISLFYPNKKQFLAIDKAEIEFSPLALFRKEILVKNVKAEKVQFSTKLLKNGKTTFQTYLENNLKPVENSDYKLASAFPSIRIDNYLIKIKDEKSGQRLKIDGKKLNVSQNKDFRYFTLTTVGAVFVSSDKRITYSSKFEIPRDMLNFTDVNNQISLDELFKQKYTADLSADLKLFSKDSKFDYANGTLFIDNFVFYLAEKALPPSYFHVKTNKGKAVVESKFYTNTNEVTNINANIKLQKPYVADVKFNCPRADISNLQRLGSAVLDLLNIKNNLADFKAYGILKADFSVIFDEKSLKSDGKLKISNGSLIHKSVPLKVSSVNAFIDFSNDKLDIKQSSALVNNQPVKISGYVLSDSTGKLSLNAENLDLNSLLKAFPFIKINNDIVLSSGKLSFVADISGKLAQASPVVNAVVRNFSGNIKSLRAVFSASKVQITTKIVKNKPSGDITVSNLSLKSNQSVTPVSLKSESLKAIFDDKNIKVEQSRLSTGNANLTLSGDIKNYQQNPDVQLNLRGAVDTAFLKSLMPRDIKLTNKGYLPVRLSINRLSSNNKSYDVDLKILANGANYITPVGIKNLDGKNSLTHIQAVWAQDHVNLKDCSLYYAQNINSLVDDVNVNGLKKIVSVKGKLKNITAQAPFLENVKILSSEPLNVDMNFIVRTLAKVNADVVLNGSVGSNLNVNGLLSLEDISVPEYSFLANSATVYIKNRALRAKALNVKLDNTILSVDVQADVPHDVKEFKKINNLNVTADFVDIEKVTQLLHKLFQAKYAPGADIPVDILAGKINIKNFKMDVLSAQNVTADYTQKGNIVHLKNLSANAYGGRVVGNIDYNLSYSSVKAVLQGRGLSAETATTVLMPKEQRLSGVLDFDADISALGNNIEQQMKSLSGRADLVIKNGYFAQLGRFEHFLYAQNLLSQKLIFASLNSTIQAISPKDTGRFTYLKGMAKFSKGYVHLNPVTTAGPQMSMYITGRINMLNNEADLKVLGKVSSEVSSSLGLLGKMTIKDFVDEHTNYGQALSDLFNFCNSELPEVDISKIPELNPDMRYQTKNFQVLLSGNMSSVKAVKSFTWVNPIGTKRKNAVVNKPAQNSSVQQDTNTITPQVNNSPDFLDSIPDNFN